MILVLIDSSVRSVLVEQQECQVLPFYPEPASRPNRLTCTCVLDDNGPEVDRMVAGFEGMLPSGFRIVPYDSAGVRSIKKSRSQH